MLAARCRRTRRWCRGGWPPSPPASSARGMDPAGGPPGGAPRPGRTGDPPGQRPGLREALSHQRRHAHRGATPDAALQTGEADGERRWARGGARGVAGRSAPDERCPSASRPYTRLVTSSRVASEPRRPPSGVPSTRGPHLSRPSPTSRTGATMIFIPRSSCDTGIHSLGACMFAPGSAKPMTATLGVRGSAKSRRWAASRRGPPARAPRRTRRAKARAAASIELARRARPATDGCPGGR